LEISWIGAERNNIHACFGDRQGKMHGITGMVTHPVPLNQGDSFVVLSRFVDH
jgi:hypothetical protein